MDKYILKEIQYLDNDGVKEVNIYLVKNNYKIKFDLYCVDDNKNDITGNYTIYMNNKIIEENWASQYKLGKNLNYIISKKLVIKEFRKFVNKTPTQGVYYTVGKKKEINKYTSILNETCNEFISWIMEK